MPIDLREIAHRAEASGRPKRRPTTQPARGFIPPGGTTRGTVIPVRLEVIDASATNAGSASARANWSYRMIDAVSGEELDASVNPNEVQHVQTRPAKGRMAYATFGLAAIIPPYTTPSLIWCNEYPVTGAC